MLKRIKWRTRAVKAQPWDTVPLYFLIIAEYGQVFTEVRVSPEQVKQNDWPFYETVIRTMNHLLRSHPT